MTEPGGRSLCQETGAVDSGDGWDTQDQDVPSKATLDPAQEESIRAVVRRYNGQVKYCYDKSLADNPELQGRVEVYLELAELVRGGLGEVGELLGDDLSEGVA